MSMLDLNLMVLQVSSAVTAMAMNWLLQSTLLISIGLFAAWQFRSRGSAFQSVVYRTTLAAVLACPFVSFALSFSGANGWSLQLPPTFVYQPLDVTALNANPAGPDKLPQSAGQPLTVSPDARTAGGDEFATTPPFRVSPNPGAVGAADVDDARGQVSSSEPAIVAAEIKTLGLQSAAETGTMVVSSSAEIWVLNVFGFGVLTIVFVIVWAAVAAILAVRLASMIIRTNRMRSQAVDVADDETAVCVGIASKMNVSVPQVLRAPFLTSPCLHGLRRPAVLLPDDTELPLADIFVHELAHLRRHDCHWLLLRRVATVVLFFQPLLLWLARRIDATAEEVCDDYVVQFGGSREGYANSLVNIAALSVAAPGLASVGMVSLRSLIGRRVDRIMDTSRSLSTRVGSLLLLLVIGSGLIGTAITGFVGLSLESTSANAAQPVQDKTAADETSEDDATGDGTAGSSDDSPASVPVNDKQPGGSEPASAKQAATTVSTIRGTVVGHNGRTVAGAKLYWYRTRVHDVDPMQPRLIATTDNGGTFSFEPPVVAKPNDEPANWSFSDHIVVVADGHGFTTTTIAALRRKMEHPDSLLGAVAQTLLAGGNSANIHLPASGESLRGRIVDIEGQPVVGATVRIRHFIDSTADRFIRRSSELPDTPVALWQSRVEHMLNIIEPVPQRLVLPTATTNAMGVFELKDVGPDRLFQLLVEGDGIQSMDVMAQNAASTKIEIPANPNHSRATVAVYGNDSLCVAAPSRTVTGTVTDLDSGLPIQNAVVRAYAVHGESIHSSREREHFAVRTDKEGRYRISGLPMGDENRLVAFTMDDTAYIPVGQQVDTSKADAAVEADFTLKRGVWAEGRVVDGTTGKPFTGELSYYWFRDKSLEIAIPGLRLTFVDGLYYTNLRGEFRVPVLATRGILAYRWDGASQLGIEARPIDKFPRGLGAESIDGKDDRMNSYPTMPHYMHAGNYNFVAEINPKVGDERITVEMSLKASQPVQLTIVTGETDAVPSNGYMVYGLNERWGWQPDQTTNLIVEDLLPQETRKVFVFHRQAGLAGSAIVDESVQQPVEIKLTKSGQVRGRLVDKSGDPITDGTLSAVYEKLNSEERYAIWASHPDKLASPTKIPVDQEGRFELDGLIPGWKYSAHVSAPRKMQGRMMSTSIGMAFSSVEIKPGESLDLGDLTVAYPPQENTDENDKLKPKGDGTPATPVQQSDTTEEKPPQPENAYAPGTEPLGFGGKVLGPDGNPVQGLTVVANIPAEGISSIKAMTDDQGRFAFHGDRTAFDKAVRERARYQATVMTSAEGLARDWRMMLMAELPDSDIGLQLREFVPIAGRIVSAEGRPLANVEVTAAHVSHAAGGLDEYIRRAQEEHLTDAATTDEWNMGGRLTTLTDDDGRFHFDTVGGELVLKLKLHGDGVADSEIVVMTRPAPEAARETGTLTTTGTGNAPHYFAEFTHVAPASRTLQGIVLDEKTGLPIQGIEIVCLAARTGGVTTKADGRFSFPGCLKSAEYQFTIRSRTQPYFGRSIKVADTDGLKPIDIEFKLQQGITAKGIVTDGDKPLDGVVYYNVLYPSPFADRITGFVPFQGYSEAIVQPNGRFEIQVLPGPGALTLSVSPSARQDVVYLLPQVTPAELEKLLGKAAKERPSDGKQHVSIHAGGPRVSAIGVVNHQALTLISPDESDETIQVQLTATPGRNLSGKVFAADGTPVSRVDVSQLAPQVLDLEPVAGNDFVVRGLGSGRSRRIVFYQPDLQQGAVLDLTGDEDPDTLLNVTLKPCGTLKGQLVDKQGNPVTDTLLVLNRRNYGGNPNTWSARTGDNGQFEIGGLVPGETDHAQIGAQTATGYVIRDVTVKSGETLELAIVVVPDELMKSTKK